MKVAIAAFVFLAWITGTCTADTNRVDYDLQERCGKNAAEYVKKQYGDASYVNHYNKNLNKCFVLIDYQEGADSVFSSVFCDGKGDQVTLLKDVHENKQFGIFAICNISWKVCACNKFNEICKSREEWDQFIKPFMEE
jgi:hypothetical protein